MSGNKYIPPWKEDILACWTICGMNHYHNCDGRRLFVSMTRFGRCITEEGKDDVHLWNRLIEKQKKKNKNKNKVE